VQSLPTWAKRQDAGFQPSLDTGKGTKRIRRAQPPNVGDILHRYAPLALGFFVNGLSRDISKGNLRSAKTQPPPVGSRVQSFIFKGVS